MQAVKSQIPVKDVQTASQKQDLNSLWAIVRRLKQRVAELELQLSCCRRDINRIDKMVYRDKRSAPTEAVSIQTDNFNKLLFGGE